MDDAAIFSEVMRSVHTQLNRWREQAIEPDTIYLTRQGYEAVLRQMGRLFEGEPVGPPTRLLGLPVEVHTIDAPAQVVVWHRAVWVEHARQAICRDCGERLWTDLEIARAYNAERVMRVYVERPCPSPHPRP
jgi:hypothetical protein